MVLRPWEGPRSTRCPRPTGAIRSKDGWRGCRGWFQVDKFIGVVGCLRIEIKDGFGYFGLRSLMASTRSRLYTSRLSWPAVPAHYKIAGTQPKRRICDWETYISDELGKRVLCIRKPYPSAMISRIPLQKRLPCCSALACKSRITSSCCANPYNL